MGEQMTKAERHAALAYELAVEINKLVRPKTTVTVKRRRRVDPELINASTGRPLSWESIATGETK